MRFTIKHLKDLFESLSESSNLSLQLDIGETTYTLPINSVYKEGNEVYLSYVFSEPVYQILTSKELLKSYH